MKDLVEYGVEEIECGNKREASLEIDGHTYKLELSETSDDDWKTCYHVTFKCRYHTFYDLKAAHKYFDKMVKKHGFEQ